PFSIKRISSEGRIYRPPDKFLCGCSFTKNQQKKKSCEANKTFLNHCALFNFTLITAGNYSQILIYACSLHITFKFFLCCLVILQVIKYHVYPLVNTLFNYIISRLNKRLINISIIYFNIYLSSSLWKRFFRDNY